MTNFVDHSINCNPYLGGKKSKFSNFKLGDVSLLVAKSILITLRNDEDLSADHIRQLLTPYVFNHDVLTGSFISRVFQHGREIDLGNSEE